MSPPPTKPPERESEARFWWVREEERVLGPYTGKQMLSFLLKGRLNSASHIRPDNETDWRTVSEEPEFARYFAPSAMERNVEGGAAPVRMPNFVIMVDGEAYPGERIDAVIGELGPHYRLMPHIWLLHCGLQVAKIRTYLVRQLGSIERLFIVDVKTGTYACHKFQEGLEDEIRRLLEHDEATAD